MRYSVRLVRSGLRLRHKRAHALLARDFVAWLRVEFLGAAAEAGVLTALRKPHTVDDLACELAVSDAGLLLSLLEVGPAEMHEALTEAGFATVEERRLAPWQPRRGFVAR